MRTILILASSAFAAATLSANLACADDRVHVTPPISREHARTIQAAHPASDLTVVPQPVQAAAKSARLSAATARLEIADR